MRGFRLGSILGFKIRIDFSWFIIFFLILWSLSSGLFPASFPGLKPGVYLAMGVVGTVLFFATLLAHELSHSLVARAKGIPVEGITLFIFGGVSQTRLDAESPGDEFQIAGVGPLVSIVIAVLCSLIGSLGNQLGWSVAVTGVFSYLAYANLAIAIFNLLPGFPLDGGRLFRSIIWKLTGNLTKATRIASMGGSMLGYFIVFWGFWQMLRGYLLGGLWLLLIGWFLNNAAEASYQEQLVRMGLEGARAWQAMRRSPETVPPHLTLRELVDEYFFLRRYHSFPVVEKEEPVGIITLNQVKEVPQQQWHERTVRDSMLPLEEGVVVRPQEKLSEVLQKMEYSGLRRVLVVQEGKIEGIITASDITRWLQRARDLEDWRRDNGNYTTP